MGRLPKRPADFIFCHKGITTLLDPKELKQGQRINIKSRLSQLPKMRQFLYTENSRAFFFVHVLENSTFYLIDAATIPDNVKSVVLENGYPALHAALGEII